MMKRCISPFHKISATARRLQTAAAGKHVDMPPGLISRTPLVESMPLSEAVGTRVLLKMETVQPSGSFKDRGMAYLCAALKRRGATSLICSSGGNAGHAVAAMGRRLEMDVKVIVPTTTKQIMIDKIREQGADVQVHGENWNAADELARSLVDADAAAEYIPPYEHELLWEGHSSLVDELVEAGERPGAIVASVGGGGLLNGIYLGLQRHGWGNGGTRVVSAETDGANCFAAAFAAGTPTRLDAINSVATSLGALQCSPTTLRLSGEIETSACTVTDREALEGCAALLNEHRVLVEPACGAAIALLRCDRHRHLFQDLESIVVVVCGGSGVNWSIMEQWRRDGLWDMN
jgi:L-serine/L-threonine ammonia-lyase